MDPIFPSSPSESARASVWASASASASESASESESKSESKSKSDLKSVSASVTAAFQAMQKFKTVPTGFGGAKQYSSQIPSKRSLQLHFEGESANTVFTNQRLKDQGVLLRVVLRDDSGSIVEVTALIRIVALHGHFPVDDIDVFTREDFLNNVLCERDGKRPLIAGESVITLKKGVSDIVNIQFTDNSSWVWSKKFRLGAQVTSYFPSRLTIREAVSEAFVVKDYRGSYVKKAIPSLNDEVYHLPWISREGEIHNRLKTMNIFSVKDLLQLYVADADSLKKNLGVSDTKFKTIVESVAPLYSNSKELGRSTISYEHPEGSSKDFEVSSNMLVDVTTPNPDARVEDSMFRWNVLLLVLRAISKMKIMVQESYEIMMLYSLLFGDNYEFEREKLIQLWMAAGFLKKEPLEDIGDRIFKIFLDKCYILPIRIKNSRQTILFKLNFELVVGIIARSKAIKGFEMRLKEDNVIANQLADFWHISVRSSSINQATFESLQKIDMLRTLLFLNNSLLTTLASDFFSTFKFLTALDLSGSCLTEVPSSIQDVTELRFLDLSWTRISRLPQSLVYLQKLQTLRLKGCMDLFELPERMNKFINIRHLDFDVLGQLMLMPTGIGHLTELRTLSAFIVDGEVINGKKCCNIKELKHMNNLSGKFCISGLEHVSSHDVEEAALTDKKHLKHLELRWSDAIAFLDKEDHVRVLEGLKPNSSLEELNIVCFPGEILSNWIEDSRYQNLVSVSLYKCEDCLNFPLLGRLPKLKNLEIVEMNAVEKIDHQFCGDGLGCVAFPLLENLSIDGMYRVESITNWDFACLVKLSINRCPRLATLSLFLRCQSLKVMEITECPLLKYLPEEMLASPLESLVIDNCPLLRETYSKGGEDSNKIKHVISVWIESDGSQSSNGHSTDDDSSTEGIH